MATNKLSVIPGEVVFKMYDTHGFQLDTIDRIAKLNNLSVDKDGFHKLLTQHKFRHKTAFKEQTDNKMASSFEETIQRLSKTGIEKTNDEFKYNYSLDGNKIIFQPLKSKLVAILNSDGDWLDFLEMNESNLYYLITEGTNFYCEEGGQNADTGYMSISKDVNFIVDSVFKIRDLIFHKGRFVIKNLCDNKYLKLGNEVILHVDVEKRLKIMKNHTAIHLLNAAIKKVLSNSVVCQVGSNVTDKGFVLKLSVYGEKITQKIVLEAQELVRLVFLC